MAQLLQTVRRVRTLLVIREMEQAAIAPTQPMVLQETTLFRSLILTSQVATQEKYQTMVDMTTIACSFGYQLLHWPCSLAVLCWFISPRCASESSSITRTSASTSWTCTCSKWWSPRLSCSSAFQWSPCSSNLWFTSSNSKTMQMVSSRITSRLPLFL